MVGQEKISIQVIYPDSKANTVCLYCKNIGGDEVKITYQRKTMSKSSGREYHSYITERKKKTDVEEANKEAQIASEEEKKEQN